MSTFAEAARVLTQRAAAVRTLTVTIGRAGRAIDHTSKRKRTFLIGVPPNLAEIVRQAVFNKQTFRPQTFGPIAAPGSRSAIVDALIAALNEARQHPRPPGQRPIGSAPPGQRPR